MLAHMGGLWLNRVRACYGLVWHLGPSCTSCSGYLGKTAEHSDALLFRPAGTDRSEEVNNLLSRFWRSTICTAPQTKQKDAQLAQAFLGRSNTSKRLVILFLERSIVLACQHTDVGLKGDR